MKKMSIRMLVASCVVSLPIAAEAQVGQTQQAQPLPQGGQVITPGQAVTPGQPLPGQVQPGQTTPGRTIPGTVQPGPGNVRSGLQNNQGVGNQTYGESNQGRQANQGKKSVQDFLVKKMMLCNKAEIELSQMAQDKASNDEVKQFAEMLVNDHRQLDQRLQQLSSNQSGGNQNQASSNQSQQEQNRNATSGDQTGRKQGQGQGGQVPQQLTMITEKAAEKSLAMAKEMLQKEEGQDFDMAFLGMTIVAHAQALAELEAIENVGSQQFISLVRESENKIKEHKQRAKELAEKIKDEKKGS